MSLKELRNELRGHRKSSMKPVSRMLKGEIIRELEHIKHRVEKETGVVEKEVKALMDGKKEKVAKVAKVVEELVKVGKARKAKAEEKAEEKKAGKGSQAMKEKMAHLRSLRKKRS